MSAHAEDAAEMASLLDSERDDALKEQVLAAMLNISEEVRLDILARFCRSCGCHDPGPNYCQCGNDE